jgi:hypothetical protein
MFIANKSVLFICLTLGIGLISSAGCDESSVASESAQDDPQVDQRLVGKWRHTDTYVSGDFSAAIDLWFVLNSDRTYEYFKGSVAAGNSDSFVANGGHGDVTRGKWRTESKVLYTCPEGSEQWREAGKYFVDEGRFMVNKVVWERI